MISLMGNPGLLSPSQRGHGVSQVISSVSSRRPHGLLCLLEAADPLPAEISPRAAERANEQERKKERESIRIHACLAKFDRVIRATAQTRLINARPDSLSVNRDRSMGKLDV